jgi:dTDP-4-dehydrorhamnose 3,5-epimerase
MRFEPTSLAGAFVIETEPRRDGRGAFARTFCAREFGAMGLATDFVQTNMSVSTRAGTLRGMHYQRGDAAEDKLVRAASGAVLDVIIDLRPESPTLGRHFKVELSAENGLLLYVPRGFAHGFLTLVDNCQVVYQVSNYYSPENEGGVRWNDPYFGIDWPVHDPIVSVRDAAFPDFQSAR